MKLNRPHAEKKLMYIFYSILSLWSRNSASGQLSFSVSSQSGNYSITCTNPTLILTASSNYSAPVSYTWASSQINSVTNSISVSNPANFTVVASSGTVSVSQTLAVTVNTTAPSLSISSSPTVFTCTNYSIALSAVADPTNSSYQWFYPSPSPDPMGPYFIAFTPGTYTCTAKNPINGCKSTKTIVLGDNRIYPFISAAPVSSIGCPNGSTVLSASVAGSSNNFIYTWTNGTAILTSGANASSLAVSSPGYYQVTVTDTLNGCIAQNLVSVYACLGDVDQSTDVVLKVFPNPFKDRLNFQSETIFPAGVSIKMLNSFGHVVYNREGVVVENGRAEIELMHLPPGTYFLTVNSLKHFLLLKD